MKECRVFITGMGVITPLGKGIPETRESILHNKRCLAPLSIFPTAHEKAYPVGEIAGIPSENGLPRTHNIAFYAAGGAMTSTSSVPGAIIVGTTTGGMPLTEDLLKKGAKDPALYRYHSTGTVAEYIASRTGCTGPVITLSTACSSGTAGVKIALEMLRCGLVKSVLVGGADALCRLTYYGFNSLQLIDPQGSRPFDRDRLGMSVGEGAAFLYLEACEHVPSGAIAEVLGGGLSCDAHHPAAPHPEGLGAAMAMKRAIEDAGIAYDDIRYINLHGTGTKENDSSEAKAIRSLFGGSIPPLSSTKGASGHSLGAAGAVEAVLSVICITDGLVPANTGLVNPDPDFGLSPVSEPYIADIKAVLSNSFGFGGNNASVVLSRPGIEHRCAPMRKLPALGILGLSCFSGAGDLNKTFESLSAGTSCAGILGSSEISRKFPPREVRRFKRLSLLTLSLAVDAIENCGGTQKPSSIFMGTGWGSLSETNDFLTKLFETNEQFPSPTDFVGSVHNAPAGLAAIRFQATGPNITATGGDYTFEQALYTACLCAPNDDTPVLLIGTDEYHSILSDLFDLSVHGNPVKSDGGGAFIVRPGVSEGLRLIPLFYQNSNNNSDIIESLTDAVNENSIENFGAVFANIPGSDRSAGEKQLKDFLSSTRFAGPVVDIRSLFGEFASATATAASVAAHCVKRGSLPSGIVSSCKNGEVSFSLGGKGILLLGLGSFITAVGILP